MGYCEGVKSGNTKGDETMKTIKIYEFKVEIRYEGDLAKPSVEVLRKWVLETIGSSKECPNQFKLARHERGYMEVVASNEVAVQVSKAKVG